MVVSLTPILRIGIQGFKGKQFSEAARERLDVISQRLAARPNRETLLRVAQVIQRDTMTQLLEQGKTQGGTPYDFLTEKYARVKASILRTPIGRNVLGPITEIAQKRPAGKGKRAVKGTQGIRYATRVTKQSQEGTIQQIREGTLSGARILQLTEFLYNQFTQFPPTIDFGRTETDPVTITFKQTPYAKAIQAGQRKIIVTSFVDPEIKEILGEYYRDALK